MRRLLLVLIAATGLLAFASTVRADGTLLPFLGGQSRPIINLDFRSLSTLPATISYIRGGATAYDFSCANQSVLSSFDGSTPMLPICPAKYRNCTRLGYLGHRDF
jgi:hypothetical protein